MPLSPGTRLGPYEIHGPLGAGGMGEVHLAKDTRLERTVAIKALPAAMAHDPERLARFEREARLLASLNHPNIASIYGLEEAEGAPHLVLEYVDGETLTARLARGPLDLREALEMATQVASAIEAAHEGGVVHRDLKPGNVMVTAGGRVKVLDFGLARSAPVGSASGPDLSASPTVALAATRDGVILGTAPYMSPEQARGKPVDRRCDVWAFGCLLFEMLTGRPAFSGETVSDVVARILEREPEWDALAASLPPRVVAVVRRCLTKEEAGRPRDIGDLGRELAAVLLEMSSPAGARPADAQDRPSLAVLYFENLSSDTESDYFCAGITEDILTDLSKIKGLRVASKNAVSRYRGQAADPAEVGRALNVRAVLEGSVRRAGERVRITTRLINTADGFQIWAERFDRTLEDVFAVQEEIASSITDALRVALTPAESARLVQDRPDDVRAYDLYLKGRALYRQYTPESIRAADEAFAEATRIDPDYALAWAGIADACGQMILRGFSSDREPLLARGLAAARKAIALNSRLPEAHKAEALVLLTLGDNAGSDAALERAVEANPRFTPAIANQGARCYDLADLAGAERKFRRILDLEPDEVYVGVWLGKVLQDTGRWEEMERVARKLLFEGASTFYKDMAFYFLAEACTARGDGTGLDRVHAEALAAGCPAEDLLPLEAAVALQRHRPEEARRCLEACRTIQSHPPGAILTAACVAVSLGDLDMAADFLRLPGLAGFADTMIRVDPRVHPILGRPGFGPRMADHALIWPLEAPMLSPAVHSVFPEVRIESGRAEGSVSRA